MRDLIKRGAWGYQISFLEMITQLSHHLHRYLGTDIPPDVWGKLLVGSRQWLRGNLDVSARPGSGTGSQRGTGPCWQGGSRMTWPDPATSCRLGVNVPGGWEILS